MPVWTLAIKDLRLLARDTRAAVILLAMPLVFIFVLGLGIRRILRTKPDDRLRVSVVILDEGLPTRIPRTRSPAGRGHRLCWTTSATPRESASK